MSYNQPVRFQYRGDKAVALRYVREARRQLGLFIDELTKTGARAGRRIRKLPDGGTVEMVVAFQQITVTITTAQATKEQVRSFDDFVVHARTQDLPDGIDPDHPQQILRSPIGKDGWRTFFYDQSTPGYDDFDRPKGTYRRNPDGTELFPDGIPSAGNIDWLGPNGERISWYGPDTRYWYDAYRQPSAQYGRYVFCLGQVLLDVDAYCLAIDDNWESRLVLGAGIKDFENGEKWLYLVTGNIADVDTPVTSIPNNTVYFSPNYPMGDARLQLHAIRLTKDTSTPEAQKWSPVEEAAAHMLMWDITVPGACNPWVFNRDCTQAVSFGHSLSPVVNFIDAYSTTLLPSGLPAEDSYRIDLTMDETTASSNTTTINVQPLGRCTCAVEFTPDNQEISIDIAREPHAGSSSAVVLYFGGMRVPMWYMDANLRPGYTHGCVRRTVVWADAREGVVVMSTQLDAWTETAPRNAYTQIRFEIVRGGAVIYGLPRAEQESFNLPTQPRNRDVGFLTASIDTVIAPFVYLWMLSAQVSSAGYRAQILGLAGSNALRPHDAVDCFGQYGTNGPTGGPVPSQSIGAVSAFFNNRVDKHGHKVTDSGAAQNGTLIFSGHDERSRIGFEGAHDESITFVTGETLPNLTGVGGAYQRYHPVWLLGLPIGGEDP